LPTTLSASSSCSCRLCFLCFREAPHIPFRNKRCTVVLSTDSAKYDGHGRISEGEEFVASETPLHGRAHSLTVG
jgi:hypothetical protein